MAIENLHDYLRRNGRHLIFSGCNTEVVRVMKNSGLLAQIGPENVFPAEANLTMSTKRALQRATELLHTRRADVRLFYERKRESATDAGPTAAGPPGDYTI
jgi:SulP family sulfate permease